jgi:hypothetical protein
MSLILTYFYIMLFKRPKITRTPALLLRHNQQRTRTRPASNQRRQIHPLSFSQTGIQHQAGGNDLLLRRRSRCE